jgi:hypothetical protein
MRYLILLGCIALLGACGGSKDEEPTGVIPQHQLDAMEKAKNVEDVLQQSDLQRRENMDKDSGG